ncbi:helix-turn-helix transcriptional regulator [Methanosarcina sp. T3]|uniref:helix-turn-helix transcriptional regulator n=1 Tax=Methanosarcina sp. T3 TaxID=3439062 RepID=UPI003F85E136
MCVQGNALAATIHGTVYEWYSFKPLENTVVEINSTPEQYFVATSAEYAFNLTPGTYLITANYFEENTVVYTAEEEVIISDDGEYVHDLLLFPTYQENLLDQGNLENVDLDFEEAEPQSQANSQNTVLALALLALCILILAGYFLKKEKRKTPEKTASFPEKTGKLHASGLNASESKKFTVPAETAGYSESDKADIEVSETDYEPPAALNTETQSGNISETEFSVQQDAKLPETSKAPVTSSSISSSEERFDSLSSEDSESPETNLPDDLKEIMNLIRANGNRITQRELRKKSPYSESKVSLMLSDLEERGLVEKFKRGRGNIIRIPDGEAVKQTGTQNRKEPGENGASQ